MTAAALPCSQRPTLERVLQIFLQVSSSLSFHPRLPLTSLCLAPLPSLSAGSALSPAVLRRGAAPGQSCLSAALLGCHELPPSQQPSPAQQQRTSPLSVPLLGSLEMSLRLWGWQLLIMHPGEHGFKSLEIMTSSAERLSPTAWISLAEYGPLQ